jgi:hypothetical protein
MLEDYHGLFRSKLEISPFFSAHALLGPTKLEMHQSLLLDLAFCFT